MIGKTQLDIDKNSSKTRQGIGEQVRFDPNTIWEVWGVAQPLENFPIFTLIYTDTKLLYKYEH